jgi:hypothetical protein
MLHQPRYITQRPPFKRGYVSAKQRRQQARKHRQTGAYTPIIKGMALGQWPRGGHTIECICYSNRMHCIQEPTSWVNRFQLLDHHQPPSATPLAIPPNESSCPFPTPKNTPRYDTLLQPLRNIWEPPSLASCCRCPTRHSEERSPAPDTFSQTHSPSPTSP